MNDNSIFQEFVIEVLLSSEKQGNFGFYMKSSNDSYYIKWHHGSRSDLNDPEAAYYCFWLLSYMRQHLV